MFGLVPKLRQRHCIVVETDRKSVPGRLSSVTVVDIMLDCLLGTLFLSLSSFSNLDSFMHYK